MGSAARIIISFVLLACLTIAAVKAYPEKTVQAGLQIIGGEADHVVFNDLLVLRNAVYIAGCSGGFENRVCSLWKIDAEGRLVSSATGVRGYFMSLASDGSRIYAAGLREHDTLPKTTGYLAVFDQDLDKLWEREWVGSSLFSWFESIVVQAGGIYVAGAVQYLGERDTDIVLHKYGEAGLLLWEKTFSLAGHQTPESMDCQDGRIYIAGTTAPPGSGGNVDGFLLVTDMNGSEVDRVTWGGDKRDFFSSVKVGEGIYVCGFTDSYGAGDLDGLLLKIDFSGRVVWWKTFGGPGDDSFTSLCLDEDRVHAVGHVTRSTSMLPLYAQYSVNGTLLGNWTLAIDFLSSWTAVCSADGVTRMVGNSMGGLFRNRGIYARYVTSYGLTVNFPGEGFWASLDGENKTGRSVSFDVTGGEHRLEAAPFKIAGETRLAFSLWSDGVVNNPREIRLKKDTVLNAAYRVEHRVEVSSPMGEVSGGGWFVEGSTATVSVSPSIIPKDFFTNYVFDGWVENGVKTSASTTYSFTVTRPIRLAASWRTELNPITAGIILLMLILVLIASLVFVRRRKTLPPPPPPLDQAYESISLRHAAVN